jgi:subtilisin family serine protease
MKPPDHSICSSHKHSGPSIHIRIDVSIPEFCRTDLIVADNTSRLIVTIRKVAGWVRALEDIQNATDFDCAFEGMLEDRLLGLESSFLLRELDHSFAILRTSRGNEFHAANQILARYGGPDGPVVAVEPDAVLFFSMPSIGLPFSLGGEHDQYLSMLNVEAARSTTSGKGVRVAILDTGANLVSINDYYDVLNLSGVHPGLPSHDIDGHGTAMTTLIREVAPDAELMVVRVSEQQQATLLNVMAGVSVGVLDCRADILNLSVGFPGFGTGCDICGASRTSRSIAFETLLRSLFQAYHPVYVASAGNDAPIQSEFEYPGAFDFAVVVGSTNSLGDRSYFSQYRVAGRHNRYAMAPGGDITPSGSIVEHVGTGPSGSCYGTSVSAAYFSGMLALFRAEQPYRSVPRDQFIDDVLMNKCVQHASGNSTEYGHGMIRYS